MIRKLSLALLALLVLPMVAQAATFTGSLVTDGRLNLVKFNTYQAILRGGNPVNPVTAYANGDVLVTLYSATAILTQDLGNPGNFINTGWTSAAGDFAVGVSYGKLAHVNNAGVAGLQNVSASTKFLSLYSKATNWVTTTTTVAGDVAGTLSSATLLASLDISTGNSGLFSWFNAANPNLKTYNASQVAGGSLLFQPGGSNGSDLEGTSFANIPGSFQWYSTGTEQMTFALVPEPGTIALWGSCLAIGAVVAYRRRKQS